MSALNRAAFTTLLLLLWLQYVGTAPLFEFVEKTPTNAIIGTFAFLGAWAFTLWAGSREHTNLDDSSEPEDSPKRGRARWPGGGGVGAAGAAAWLAGVLPHFGLGASKPTPWVTSLLVLLGAVALPAGWARLRGRAPLPGDLLRSGALFGLGLAASMVGGLRYQRLPLLDGDATGTWVTFGVAAVCMAGVALRGKPDAKALGALLGAGVLLRGAGLWSWDINPSTRDMLALIMSAQDTFLSGANPYGIHTMQRNSEIPLTYLPAMWTLYMPPRLLGLDIRWMGVLADAAVVAALWWGTLGHTEEKRMWYSAAALGLGAAWLCMPTVHWNGIYAEPNLWWGLLACTLVAILRRRWWWAAVGMGIVLSTRHFGVLLLPFFLVGTWHALGWRGALARLCVSGGVCCVLWLPFLSLDPEVFWFGTFHWLRAYGPAHETWFHYKFGFSGLLYHLDHTSWAMPLQALCVTACACASAALRRHPRAIWSLGALAYMCFIMFNGLIWASFYLGVVVYVALVLLTPKGGSEDAEYEALPRGVWRATLVATPLVGLGAGYVLMTLAGTWPGRGLEDAKAAIGPTEWRKGDVVLDRHTRRLAFIKGEWVAERAELRPARLGHDPFGGRLGARGIVDASRAWSLIDTERDHTFVGKMKALGKVVEERDAGRYIWLGVDLPKSSGVPLSRMLDRDASTIAPTGGEPIGFDDDEARKAGEVPGWVKAEAKRCEVGKRKRPMLYVHPWEGGVVELVFPKVPTGDRLLLAGGIQDKVVEWGRGAVDVTATVAGGPEHALRVENTAGVQWTVLDTSGLEGETFELRVKLEAEDDGQRWFCLEGWSMAFEDEGQ